MSPYMQIPCFIDKALSYAGLGRYERMVMSEVMEQVYGVAKRPVAVVNQTVIAKAFGIPRQRVQEAVKSLVKSRILIVQGEFFTFNDVFTEWARPDLTWPENVVASLDVSRSSVTKARYTVQSDTASVTPQRDNSTVDRDKSTLQRDTSTVTQESVTPDRAPLSRSSVTTCHAPALQPDNIPPDPPIGTRAELNSEKKREEERKTESLQPQTQIQQPIQPEASPTPERSPFWEPKTYDELWAWVDEHEFDTSGMEGSQLSGLCKTYTTRWVYYSLRIAVQREIDQPKAFITKILREWHAKGQKAIQGGGHASSTPWIDYERIKLDEPEEDEKPDPNDFRHWSIERRIERNKQILAFQAEKERKLAERAQRLQQQAQRPAPQGVASV